MCPQCAEISLPFVHRSKQMNVLVGIAELSGVQPPQSLRVLADLSIPILKLDMVHVIAPLVIAGFPTEVVTAAEAVMWNSENEAASALSFMETLSKDMLAAGETVNQIGVHVLDGSPAYELLRFADVNATHLVAVSASMNSNIEALLTGSVARNVTNNAHQSVLIGRPRQRSGKLRVVLGTDHSDYANMCIEQFIGWSPRGIESIEVVTAFEDTLLRSRAADIGVVGVSAADAVRDAISARTTAVAMRLKLISPKTHASVVVGSPPDALRQVAEETNADVIIVCAKGHSMLERLTLGSTSLALAIDAPCSVMVLRHH
jgi:nucleotide-binding universal stress UspA family protein